MCEVVAVIRLGGPGKGGVLPVARSMFEAQQNRMSEGFGFSALDLQTNTFGIYQSLDKPKENPVLQGIEAFPPGFDSPFIMAHGRYPTAGASIIKNAQPMQNDPLQRRPPRQRFAMIFNGNIANADNLASRLHGVDLQGSADTEILMRTIERIADEKRWPAWHKVFKELEGQIDGGCSLCLMDGMGNFVAYRNLPGLTPLWLGEDPESGLLMVASETYAFKDHTKNFREVSAGSMIVYDHETRSIGEYITQNKNGGSGRLNAAEVIYTANSQSLTNGPSNFKTRRKIGMGMAHLMAPKLLELSQRQRDKILVIGVPRTGLSYGKGFTEGLIAKNVIPDRHYPEGIKRNEANKNGRSFMANTDEERLRRAELKHNVIPGDVEGKSVYPFDDSFVRSFTSRVLTRKLWTAGAAEINWVFGSPPFIGADYYGVDIATLNELGFWQIWQKSSQDEQRQLFQLGKDNRVIIDLELFGVKTAERLIADATGDLIAKGKAVPPPIPVTVTYTPLEILESNFPGGTDHYSWHLFTGDYPTPAGQQRFNENLRRLIPA